MGKVSFNCLKGTSIIDLFKRDGDYRKILYSSIYQLVVFERIGSVLADI